MLLDCPRFDFRASKTIPDADVILYTGGADVNPQLYGEPALNGTYCNYSQDKFDLMAFNEGKRLGKFHLGICRGAQFLCVLNKGRLWQDVDNHAGPNHEVIDSLTGKKFLVSSLHHQQMILGPESTLLAYTRLSTRKKSSDQAWYGGVSSQEMIDPEAAWWPKTRSLGVQWHPECGPRSCVELFFDYFEKYYPEAQKEEAA